MTEKNNKNILYCSFCGKSQHEVKKLIAGPTVFICDECVELCMDIIKEENKETFVKKEETIESSSNIKNTIKNSIEDNFKLDLLEGTEAYYSERYGWTLRRTK